MTMLASLAIADVTGINGIAGIFCKVLNYLFTFSMAVGVIMVILAGYYYMTAAGDEEKVQTAHKTLRLAIVGIAVAILAGGVPYIIGDLLGATVPNAPGCPAGGGNGSGSGVNSNTPNYGGIGPLPAHAPNPSP